MKNVRVIPVLLLKNGGLYKSVRFKDLKYVGDPINAVRIFNEKEVDELIFLDIEVTKNQKQPDYRTLTDIAAECFMPLCYGGGVQNLKQIEKILYCGVEKISLNSAAFSDPGFVRQAADRFGSSTIVVSIDVKKTLFGGYKAFTVSGSKNTRMDPITFAKMAEDSGAGEILLNSIDADGTMQGYDFDLLRMVSSAVSVPVIASGGAGSLKDMKRAINESGASAVAAGSFFVFQGSHRAVLITYPDRQDFERV